MDFKNEKQEKLSDKEGPQKTKKEKKKILEKAKKVWDDIWDIEKEFSKAATLFVKAVKVTTVSFNKFLKDDCLSRASSIAYTTIVSLIPTLTVGFSLFSAFGGMGARKEEMVKMAEQYVREHNMNLDITPYVDAIGSVTDNAAGIGGIGLLVLIFSATAVLRTLEKTFNDIWKIKVQRTLLMKVIYYWAALTLGPMLLATGGSLAGILANIFTMPTITDVQKASPGTGQVWIIGDRGLLQRTDLELKNRNVIDMKSIDFDNQKGYVIAKSVETSFIRSVTEEEKLSAAVSEKNIKKTEFVAISTVGKNIQVAAKDGTLLLSQDGGKRWNIVRIGSVGRTGAFSGLEITDIYFPTRDRGFIISGNGKLLRTTNGGRNWALASIRFDTKRIEVIRARLNSIYFPSATTGFIVANKAGLILTMDGGETWAHRTLTEAKVDKRLANLFSIHSNNRDYWIVGENGLIMFSNNGGRRWLRRNKGDFDYNSVIALGEGKAVIAGKEGYLLNTIDGGETWTRVRKGSLNFKTLYPINKGVMVFGENLSAYKSGLNADVKTDWKKISGGKSFWASMINFLAPFVVIWLLFVVAYITLPNLKVPFKAAAIGASVTSAVWVIFIFAFMFYVTNLTGGTRAIYGALAAIPLFLLMIYASSVITLLGAEMTYTLQHPGTYSTKKGIKEVSLEKDYLYDSINVLFSIFKNFEYGKGATIERKLQGLMTSGPQDIPAILEIYLEKGYIKKTDKEGEYLPMKSGRLITLEDVLSALFRKSFEIPNYNSNNPLMKFLKENFDELDKFRESKFEKITLEYLVKNKVMLRRKSRSEAATPA